MEDLKKFSGQASGRKSILHGAKHTRGFVIRPEQILSLFHDTMPQLPIPQDAEFCGVGMEDAGVDSMIQFFFTSKMAPHEHCFQMKPQLFLKYLIELAQGLLPADTELDGIEVSSKFTVLMLRVKSDHFPPVANPKEIPLVHLRYDLRRLILCDASKAIENEKRIVIN